MNQRLVKSGLLAGAVYAVTSPTTPQGEDGPGDSDGARPVKQGPRDNGGTFMKKMEDRWEKRSGDDSRF